MPTPRYDLAIVGGGIVGLATARAVARRHRRSVVVLEAEERLAAHQSGRNSGVLHSGLYYRPGSLKATLCVEGRQRLERYCAERGLPHRRCGKLVVAVDEGERPALDELARRGRENGLAGLERLAGDELARYEPEVAGVAGLWVPATGVVDYRAVAGAFAAEVGELSGRIETGARVRAIRSTADGLELASAAGAVRARALVNCAGLESDRVARLAGVRPDVRIIPFRGEYFELTATSATRVRGLVYPVPDPALPFLGVHLTRTLDDRVLAGPNAVLAASRRGYARASVSVRDVVATLAYPGFWRLARRLWRVGLAEARRSLSRSRYAAELRRLVPSIDPADLSPAPAGIRAQAVDRQGRLVDDFHIAAGERALHVLNAPSPAATASMAIGRLLAERAARAFGWAAAPPPTGGPAAACP